MNEAATLPGGRLPKPKPWQRNLTFGFLGLTIVSGWAANAVFATLVDRHPVVLIAMNSTPKYLILTVNQLEPWTYYLVASTRLMITKPLMWLVGGWYGNRAVAWAAQRSERSARILRWLEAQFSRIGWLVVPLTSNNAVCLLAGSTGFPLIPFLALALAGTLVRLTIYDAFGDAFRDPIDEVVSLITEYRVPIVIVCTIGVLGVAWYQHRHGTSPLEALSELGHEPDPDPEPGPED